MRADILIRGALIADGVKAPASVKDVAIARDKVVAVGSLAGVSAATEIDAQGCVVLPGFVDAHVHAEMPILRRQSLEALLLQGITTVILGQDGTSLAPTVNADVLKGIGAYWAGVNGPIPPDLPPMATVGEFLAAADGAAVNAAYLVPNGNLRLSSVGWSPGPADSGQIRAMRNAVAQGLAEGAVGLSSGLDYVPSRFADARELTQLAHELAGAGLPYVTHMRGYRSRAEAAIDEAIQIAETAEVPLHVSHFSGRVDEVLPHLDRASARVDVTFDTYPFIPSSTILAMAALPRDMQEGSPAAVVSRAASPQGRGAVRRYVENPDERDVGAMILTFVGARGFAHLEGMTLDAAAESEGIELPDLIIELLVQAGFAVGIIDQRRGAFTESDIVAVARDPRHMVGSDGTYVGSHPHVRSYSTFVKFIDVAVLASGGLAWHEAAEHLASRAARRFRLSGRGRIVPGSFADLVVLDPAALRYSADVRQRPERARGVTHVFVNGVHTVDNGELTGQVGGRALRAA